MHNKNYFELFEIEQSVIVDLDILDVKYHKLISIYHPDKYKSKSEQEQQQSILNSSYINTAYATLKDTLKTIAYIYKLHNNQDIVQEENIIYDNSLNVEFFNLYVAMNEVSSIEEYNQFKKDAKKQELDLLTQINNLNFVSNAQEIQQIYIKLKYINRILEQSVKRKQSLT